MTNPVAPVEGHYAMLRSGAVKYLARGFTSDWENDGKSKSDYDEDIIATISPGAMKLAANPELIADLVREAFDTSPAYTSLKGTIEKMLAENERLRAALKQIEAMDYINQLSGNANFERAQIIARTALEGGAV